MYITSIEIENLLSFERTTLDLKYPDKNNPRTISNINLIIGDNGAGKTSLLKAVALAALSPIALDFGIEPYRLAASSNIYAEKGTPKENKARTANIYVDVLLNEHEMTGPTPGDERAGRMGVRLDIDPQSQNFGKLISKYYSASLTELSLDKKMYSRESSEFLIFAYGVNRGAERTWREDRRFEIPSYGRIHSLFEDRNQFASISRGRGQGYGDMVADDTVNLINSLLPLDVNFHGEYVNDEMLFEVHGRSVPFGALPDSLRTQIVWLDDLACNLLDSTPPGARLADAEGLVLVDEIDLHFFPEWQRYFLTSLSKALPNIQFMLTSHSPIIAGSVYRNNIHVLEIDSDGKTTARQYEEHIYGLDSEQILLSSYFGLPTSRAESFVNELRELSLKAGKGDKSAAIQFMQRLARGAPDDVTELRWTDKKYSIFRGPQIYTLLFIILTVVFLTIAVMRSYFDIPTIYLTIISVLQGIFGLIAGLSARFGFRNRNAGSDYQAEKSRNDSISI